MRSQEHLCLRTPRWSWKLQYFITYIPLTLKIYLLEYYCIVFALTRGSFFIGKINEFSLCLSYCS